MTCQVEGLSLSLSLSKTTWYQEWDNRAKAYIFLNLSIMADGLPKPEPLCFQGDVALNWKHFTHEVEIFITASHEIKDDRTKAYIFLNLAGKEAIDKEKSFADVPVVLNKDGIVRVKAEYRESIEVFKRKFCEICDPRGNVTMERHKLNTQNSGRK